MSAKWRLVSRSTLSPLRQCSFELLGFSPVWLRWSGSLGSGNDATLRSTGYRQRINVQPFFFLLRHNCVFFVRKGAVVNACARSPNEKCCVRCTCTQASIARSNCNRARHESNYLRFVRLQFFGDTVFKQQRTEKRRPCISEPPSSTYLFIIMNRH